VGRRTRLSRHGPCRQIVAWHQDSAKDVDVGRVGGTTQQVALSCIAPDRAQYLQLLVALAAVALVFWRTRRWWFAVIPAIAISLQAAVFVAATLVTGRPRPDVPHLDPAPPTSSYPSGHVGASVALYASFAIMATTIERSWLRRTVIAVCSVIPILVAYARLYRGMHHLSDVIIGALNGLICAGLAAYCLYRTPKRVGLGQQ
jgi:membrane-associated phospholipid phosphatase